MRWRLRTRHTLGILATSVLRIACSSGGDSDELTGPNVCTGGVTLTIEPTPTPDFDWMPNCGLAQLVVQEVEAPAVGAVRWRIVGDALRPPIHYGVVPAGGTAVHPAEPLHAGHTYRVTAHLDRSPSAPVAGSVTWIATIIGSP